MQFTAITFFAGVYQRIIAMVLTLLSLFTAAKPDNVKLTVLSATEETVTIEYKNDTGKTVGTEKRFCIEKQNETGFEILEFKEDAAFLDIYEELLPKKTGSLKINILDYYSSPLEKGTYRIVFFYSCLGAQSASAEFTVE